MENRIISLWLLLTLTGCAGPNPNIGERTTDYAWLSGNFSKAYDTVKPHADAGEPWAQLRLGILYSNGWGVEHNKYSAVKWYEKAAAQKADGDWAEGVMIGSIGRAGYFNQNSDARIAQYNLAVTFFNGVGINRDIIKSYINIRTVVEETNGKPIFFCCEFEGNGRYFTPEQISDLYNEVLKNMTSEEKLEAEKIFSQNYKNSLHYAP